MSLKLHTETYGRGPDLFLVHGWALHGGVWSSLVPELARDWRVTCVDLPGHGRSREVPMPPTLPELARLVAQAAPGNSVWLGWSLGGMVVSRAALDFPERISALLLVSTTPRFVTAANWPCAMPPAQLAEFTTELARDYRSAVQRFLALQTRGAEHARDTLRQLRATLLANGEPHSQSLAAGLEILRNSDLRHEVRRLTQRTLVMAGGCDRLTPEKAGAWLAAEVPHAGFQCFLRAAHAPFLSHPREFITALRDFLIAPGKGAMAARVVGVSNRG